MKKLLSLVLALIMISSMLIIPTHAFTDGELIFEEDFENTTIDYTDEWDNYDVIVENGKMSIMCYNGSKFYKLPIPVDVAGLETFTVVFDWEVVFSNAPTNAGHTLYFAYGIKDANNANYVGYSHVNGSEHVGTIVNGTWGRAYRTHFSEPTTDKTVGKTIDAVADTPKLRIKIEVDKGTTAVFVNGKREMLNESLDWKDMNQVGTLSCDGGMGFVSRGAAFTALVDYVAVYAGVGILGIDDLAPADAVTTPAETTTPAPVETTTAAPVETTPAPAETTTAAPEVETTTAEPAQTTPAPTTITPAPNEQKSGCGSVVALGVIACLIPAAVVVCKKRK